jgi:hypothetical protein
MLLYSQVFNPGYYDPLLNPYQSVTGSHSNALDVGMPITILKAKAVPLHAMEVLGGRCIAPTHSRP